MHRVQAIQLFEIWCHSPSVGYIFVISNVIFETRAISNVRYPPSAGRRQASLDSLDGRATTLIQLRKWRRGQCGYGVLKPIRTQKNAWGSPLILYENLKHIYVHTSADGSDSFFNSLWISCSMDWDMGLALVFSDKRVHSRIPHTYARRSKNSELRIQIGIIMKFQFRLPICRPS